MMATRCSDYSCFALPSLESAPFLCSVVVAKCSNSFASIYKSWLALKVMHDYVVRMTEQI